MPSGVTDFSTFPNTWHHTLKKNQSIDPIFHICARNVEGHIETAGPLLNTWRIIILMPRKSCSHVASAEEHWRDYVPGKDTWENTCASPKPANIAGELSRVSVPCKHTSGGTSQKSPLLNESPCYPTGTYIPRAPWAAPTATNSETVCIFWNHAKIYDRLLYSPEVILYKL